MENIFKFTNQFNVIISLAMLMFQLGNVGITNQLIADKTRNAKFSLRE